MEDTKEYKKDKTHFKAKTLTYVNNRQQKKLFCGQHLDELCNTGP